MRVLDLELEDGARRGYAELAAKLGRAVDGPLKTELLLTDRVESRHGKLELSHGIFQLGPEHVLAFAIVRHARPAGDAMNRYAGHLRHNRLERPPGVDAHHKVGAGKQPMLDGRVLQARRVEQPRFRCRPLGHHHVVNPESSLFRP